NLLVKLLQNPRIDTPTNALNGFSLNGLKCVNDLTKLDMWRAYSDMREANYKNADKYFHARGNYDAAQRGPGGKWAAEVISDAREGWQGGISGRGAEDTRQDQEANAWGRSGGDPNRYRPEGLPSKY
uniref:Serum amyloid A protein n=1 Tax=Chelonoidis abingdonii TaxID=106734 RepID=A0A8C0J2H7_CHEAB